MLNQKNKIKDCGLAKSIIGFGNFVPFPMERLWHKEFCILDKTVSVR